MISEVMNERINQNIDSFLEEIVRYFGKEYKNKINDKIEKTHIAVIRSGGVVEFGDQQLYIEDEPVCAKHKEESYIFVPLSLMKEETGNVIFVHQLVHAIVENGFEKESNLFNEVLIDYIANDISANLEKRCVNFTFNKNPSYKSKSFYSGFFPIVKKIYKENKDDLIKLYMGDIQEINCDVTHVLEELEKKLNIIMSEQENQSKDNQIKKR